MGQYSSYYKYQKYEKRGEQDWIPVYPNTFSISGDSEITMSLVLKSECDANCGCQTTIYRWVDLDPSVDWICDECETPSTQYKWVNLDPSVDYYCSGTDKYYKQQRQVSYDGGQTWIPLDEYQMGGLYQRRSSDCGYVPTMGEYLIFVASEAGAFSFSGTLPSYTSSTENSVQYSLDSGITWINLASGESTSIVQSGKEIWWKGECKPRENVTIEPYCGIGRFSSTHNFTAEGNPLSLIYGDNFDGVTDISNKWMCFCNLFSGCTKLTSIENLELVATTLSWNCYGAMFKGCTSLTSMPSDLLPATTLAAFCYNQMFWGCTSLTSLPQLPATTLAVGCYSTMFNNCKSLTSIPNNYLPVTTLAEQCYSGMFAGCTSLTTVPSNLLPATTLAASCYAGMFIDCSGLTSLPQLPATTLANSCYATMFSYCTSLTSIPNNYLPVTTLATSCYASMFKGCYRLATIPSNLLPATTLAGGCYAEMFRYCISLQRAPELLASELAGTCYSYMFYGCSSLNYIKCLATDISASGIDNWVGAVAETGTFVKDTNTTWPSGYNGIPEGWTIINA